MKYRNKPVSFIPLVDIFMTLMCVFIALMVVAMVQVNPSKSKNEEFAKPKAEFLLTMTWPDDAMDDIDMWTLLPDGKKLWFRNTDEKWAQLDRDDRGLDPVFSWGGPTTYTMINQEIMTVRAIVPGVYVVNAHVYKNYEPLSSYKGSVTKLPYNVHLKVQKLNPIVETVVETDVELAQVAEQKTLVSFAVNERGKVVSIDTKTQVPIVDPSLTP